MLGLSDNELTALPPAVASLINLTNIDLSKNGELWGGVGMGQCQGSIVLMSMLMVTSAFIDLSVSLCPFLSSHIFISLCPSVYLPLILSGSLVPVVFCSQSVHLSLMPYHVPNFFPV